MQHSDVRSQLQDAINDHRQSKMDDGKYSHSGDSYIDHDGDGSEGNVTYCCKGDLKQAPYSIGTRGGKAGCDVDFDSASDVVPVTSYLPQADDEDHYTSMDEAFRKAKLYTDLPIYERFISQSTRDAADTSSFAGKGRSFPILKPADVSAALHSIGRAGPGNYSADTIRNNIKRIAKAKGFPLPDSLKERAAGPTEVLIEFKLAGIEADAELKEAAEYPVKLMSPGRGSSGYYPEDVVKRDGPKIFKSGTQMFWDHATDTEEAERPEGSLNNLAAVLTSDARYNEAGKDGPGLYATAKVFGPYVDKVKEMGQHIGLSIRAGGTRDESAKGPDGKAGVITGLKQAQSVDFVTKAGRDGKIFTEAARGASEGDDMDAAEMKKLMKDAIAEAIAPLQAENKALKEAIAAQGATQKLPELVHKALADLRLPIASKTKLFEHFTSETARSVVPLKEGAVDAEALGKLIEAAAVREAQFLMDLGYGDAVPQIGQRVKPDDVKESDKKVSKDYEDVMTNLAEIFVGPKLGKDNSSRDARKASRKAFREGRAA